MVDEWEHASVTDATRDLGPGPWWIAHEHPERTPDGWVLWSWCCDACVMHLVAGARDPRLREQRIVDYDGIAQSWEDIITRVSRWRAIHGLPVIG
jgi:hypothetical protein